MKRRKKCFFVLHIKDARWTAVFDLHQVNTDSWTTGL